MNSPFSPGFVVEAGVGSVAKSGALSCAALPPWMGAVGTVYNVGKGSWECGKKLRQIPAVERAAAELVYFVGNLVTGQNLVPEHSR
eukprot:1099813-Rhodomonas_salina.1